MWIYILFSYVTHNDNFILDRISDKESDAQWWATGFPEDIVMAYEIGV